MRMYLDCPFALLAVLLLSSHLHAQFTFQPRHHGDIEAVLIVEAGKHTAQRGLGEVTLTLTVTGPLTLDVEKPRLGDAAAAWKEERLPSSHTVQDPRVVWSQVIRLKQVKPGIEPVPDVTIRFRNEAASEWIEEKWIDILRNIQDGSITQPTREAGPSWLRRWGFALILAATASLVLLAWLGKRFRVRREKPLPPDQWALREIERIETTIMPPNGEAEAYHTRISFVVRRYLAERFGLRVLQQTTAEFLQSICHVPQLSVEKQPFLIDLFERCDRAKFARAEASPEECQHTAKLARDLVRQTSNG